MLFAGGVAAKALLSATCPSFPSPCAIPPTAPELGFGDPVVAMDTNLNFWTSITEK